MKLKLLILLVASQFAMAQHRTCGMQEKMEQIMSNPVERQKHIERQAKFEIEYQKLLNQQSSNERMLSPNAIITIPVAVHFPSVPNSTPEATKVLYRNFAQTQIDVINADYNATNLDISNWATASTFYPGVNVGDLDLNFVIATQNHPAGTGLSNGIAAITFGTDFLGGADSDATWSGYMNFVVRDLGTGLLGYSPLAGSPGAGETVVMNTWCYGSGSGVPSTAYVPAAPFDLGRTVTHELGHFFNLDHIFKSSNQSSTNCGGQDQDGIADTPKQAGCTYGCAAPGSRNACISPQKVLSMNYMDYSDDACMYMFTAGQATRALAYINTIVSEFKPNVLAIESFSKNTFDIYPNPNKGSFTIQLDEVKTDYFIQITDQSGKIVYEEKVLPTSDLARKIDLNSMASGVYFVKIKTEDAAAVKKIIIE
jgi:hypothetical protein